MRLFLSLLILTILGICHTQGGNYITMPPSEFRSSALASQLRDRGIQLVLAQAVELNIIAAPNYVLRTTDSVATQTGGSSVFYRYTCTLVNPNDDVFTTTFVMRYNTNTQISDLFTRSWRIQFANAASSARAYVPLDSSEFNNPFILELANFGKNFVENRAIRLGWIEPGTHDIVAIHYVQRQELVDGSNYQIGLNFESDDDRREVKAGFRVKYVDSTGFMNVTAFNYTMVPSTTPTVVPSVPVPAPEPEPEPEEEEVIVEEVIPEEVIPEEVVPEVVIPEEVIPEEVIPVEVIPEEVIPEEVIPEEVIPEEVIPEEVIPEEIIPEEVVVPEEETPVTPPPADTNLTPNTGSNQFGFSTRPGRP